jgi:hypothetical protein
MTSNEILNDLWKVLLAAGIVRLIELFVRSRSR